MRRIWNQIFDKFAISADVYLETCQTSIMELFLESSYRLKAVIYIPKNVPSLSFDKILITFMNIVNTTRFLKYV